MAIIAAYTYQNKIFAKMVHCIFMLDDLLMYQNLGKSKLGTPPEPKKNGSSVPKCIKDKLGTPPEPKKQVRGVPKFRKRQVRYTAGA